MNGVSMAVGDFTTLDFLTVIMVGFVDVEWRFEGLGLRAKYLENSSFDHLVHDNFGLRRIR